MKFGELKTALLGLLQTAYPVDQYKYYSMAVVEGFDRPSFFTQLQPILMEPSNYNSESNQAAFYITYMQKSIDEADILDKVSEIKKLFGLAVAVGDRAVKVTGFDWEYIGTDRNIPQITIDLEWMDRIEHVVEEPIMMSAELNQELKED